MSTRRKTHRSSLLDWAMPSLICPCQGHRYSLSRGRTSAAGAPRWLASRPTEVLSTRQSEPYSGPGEEVPPKLASTSKRRPWQMLKCVRPRTSMGQQDHRSFRPSAGPTNDPPSCTNERVLLVEGVS